MLGTTESHLYCHHVPKYLYYKQSDTIKLLIEARSSRLEVLSVCEIIIIISSTSQISNTSRWSETIMLLWLAYRSISGYKQQCGWVYNKCQQIMLVHNGSGNSAVSTRCHPTKTSLQDDNRRLLGLCGKGWQCASCVGDVGLQ
jgi:hypothetical protein